VKEFQQHSKDCCFLQVHEETIAPYPQRSSRWSKLVTFSMRGFDIPFRTKQRAVKISNFFSKRSFDIPFRLGANLQSSLSLSKSSYVENGRFS
jgi:hypothetical protein